MKTIKDAITESTVDEASKGEYIVCFLGFEDKDGFPVKCKVYVPYMTREFENFLEKEQENVFSHAYGGSIEY